MFRAYCAKIGVAFEAQMLNWDNDAKDASVFSQWMPWFEGALTSRTFQPSATTRDSPCTMVPPELPRYVQQTIDDSDVYYRRLYDLRLTPATHLRLTYD